MKNAFNVLCYAVICSFKRVLCNALAFVVARRRRFNESRKCGSMHAKEAMKMIIYNGADSLQ